MSSKLFLHLLGVSGENWGCWTSIYVRGKKQWYALWLLWLVSHCSRNGVLSNVQLKLYCSLDKFQETSESISLDPWILVANMYKCIYIWDIREQERLAKDSSAPDVIFKSLLYRPEKLHRIASPISHFTFIPVGISRHHRIIFLSLFSDPSPSPHPIPFFMPFRAFRAVSQFVFLFACLFFRLMLPSVSLTIPVIISICQVLGLKLYPSLPRNYRPAGEATFSRS